jgi:pimeloyl-ACP methyl ester carboxylesterase
MQHQPTGWASTVTYCGWRHVPSTYVVAKKDKLIPVAVQTHMAQLAGSEIKELDVGHMVMLVSPEEVADIVKAAAQKVVS